MKLADATHEGGVALAASDLIVTVGATGVFLDHRCFRARRYRFVGLLIHMGEVLSLNGVVGTHLGQ